MKNVEYSQAFVHSSAYQEEQVKPHNIYLNWAEINLRRCLPLFSDLKTAF